MRARPGAAVSALLLAAVLAVDSEARMYQWVSPGTGTVQLSGEPPPWYRSARGGPRVRVFEQGNLVDDTAIELPPRQRQVLRSEAFEEAEQRERAKALERLERAAQREQRLREERARRVRERALAGRAEPSAGAAGDDRETPLDAASLDEDTVARLKAIIAEFDRQGGATRSARGASD